MGNFVRIVVLDVRNLIKNPVWLIYGLFFPFVLTLVMGFLSSVAYGEQFTSYDYYGITMMLYSVLNASTFAANCFLEERVKKANFRLLYGPLPAYFIPLAKIVATWLFCCFFYTLSGILMVLVFNVNFGGTRVFWVWLIFVFCAFVASAFGVLMCLVFKSEGVANQFTGIFLAVFCALSGVFVPVASLGAKIQKFSQWMPLKQVLHVLFQVIYDRRMSGVLTLVWALVALSVAICLLCGLKFKGENFL